VERVVKVLPQLQTTLISEYSGWMFGFMVGLPGTGVSGKARHNSDWPVPGQAFAGKRPAPRPHHCCPRPHPAASRHSAASHHDHEERL
jgi:hypothetical protein